MPEVGIVMTLRDRISATMNSIKGSGQALSKEFDDLLERVKQTETQQTSLAKEMAKTQSSITKQTETVKAAKKEWDALRKSENASAEALDEAEAKFQNASEELDNLKNKLNEYRASTKDARLEMKDLTEEFRSLRKEQTAISGGGSSGSSDGELSIASLSKGLIAGQVGQMFAASLGEIGTAALTSAIGTPEASLIADTLSSAIAGAAVGSIIPGIGTAIGAGVGAFSGFLSGKTQIFQAKDDAFKDYYAGLYDTVNANTEEMISSGSTIAGGREQTFKAFAKRLGSDEEAKDYLEKVKTMAAGTNYDYDEITGYSKQLLNSYDPDEVFGVLQSLSDATAGLDLSSSDVSVMISGLSRMRTTGKATQEYLNYFSERGIDVYEAISEYKKSHNEAVEKSEVAGLVSKGEIGGEDAAQAILDYIDQEYGGLSEDLMSTYDAMTANLADIMSNLDAAAGEGYNEMRKSGLDAEADAYGGALGEALEEVNRISGKNKAYMENLSEQYTREALGALLLGEEAGSFSEEDRAALEAMRVEYQAASEAYANGSQEAGLTMERLREDAEALATAAYESSEQYQTYMDEQLEQIEAIRENTAGLEAATNAYLMSQEKSKGEMATETGQEKVSGFLNFLGIVGEAAENAAYGSSSFGTAGFGYSGAYGFESIPYDGFPAVLHEGERVLTASQARAQDSGSGGIQIIVTGNTFQGAGEEMADQIAGILARKMEQAAIAAAPR